MKSRKENRDTNILLIDCSNLIYAAYYTTGTLSWEGKWTGIIYGFLKKVLFLANKFNTNRFVMCWDSPYTYRHEDYKGYKKSRIDKKAAYTPLEREEYNIIKDQTITLRTKTLPFMGFHNNYFQEYYEADDLLAWWTNTLYDLGERKIIMVTSDNDMYQCLDKCKIYSIAKKKIFTRKNLLRQYGVHPESWTYLKALGGCSGDDIIGVKGVSDAKNKTSRALAYVRGELKYGVVYDRIISKKSERIVKRNLPLVTCPYRPDDLGTMIRRRDKFTREKFIFVFDTYHFKSLLKKESFKQWKQAFLRY